MKAHLFLLALLAGSLLHAQTAPASGGTITGSVIDPAGKRGVEFVTVLLKNKATGETVRSAATDAKGAFRLEGVPFGDFQLAYSVLGADEPQSVAVALDAQHRAIDLGRLALERSDVLKMEKVEVKAKQSAFLNTIDRKVYNVGKEIQSATGTASDLLQNIPSVQVDIDGNVSLRGSDNVMILIDGRSSALMGRTRAEVLQQLPAEAIEKIEVITNPSAKFKPDGTAGIINIAMKKKREPGYSGSLNVNYGNEERFNASLSASYNPGKYTMFGSYSLRQDDRERMSDEHRTMINTTTGVAASLERHSVEQARPFSRVAQAGADFSPDNYNKVSLTGNYVHRTQVRRSVDHVFTRDNRAGLTGDSERTRHDPEMEEKMEVVGTFQHRFAKADHELKLEVKTSTGRETEDNHYGNAFRVPVRTPTFENILIKNRERSSEVLVEYTNPVDDASKFEAGYTLTAERFDADFGAEFQNPAGTWTRDLTRSNRFKVDSKIHAFYATYGHTWAKFGLLAGLRPELAEVKSRLVNTGTQIPNDYSHLYPTLHLAYQLTGKHELQANYSHRVHRPDIDEMNPFPEYADPFNLRAGNPKLRPEDIHSIEAGFGFKGDNVNFTSTVYHRHLYHGFTNVTRDLGNSVLFTTRENLTVSRSTGVELTATADLGKRASVNFSSNTYFNSIDASNLGFTSRKSDVSWSAKLGGSFHVTKETLVQANTSYQSARLTPQGSRRPSGVVNAGIRRDFPQKKVALVFTVSDVFNTLRESTRLDTPYLKQDVARRRSPRIFHVGLIHHFGKAPKKSKDEGLKFDNSI